MSDEVDVERVARAICNSLLSAQGGPFEPAKPMYDAARAAIAAMCDPFDGKTLTDAIEEGWEIGPSTESALSVTGEPYVVIGEQIHDAPMYSGTIDEGCHRELSFDAETAYWSALRNFRSYAEGRKGILYWRTKPQLEWNDEKTRCTFYLRLVISDKAPQRERMP